eukprot:CAMPEP_0197898634 /NCGR_PEP_ID=MMETSP1439-20131203/44488_1 /TAXON_ID=66791 /ORGANISM="Gonyaulax spinifera, Strain CCMP409" /LENGTH=86 /DNA_ID=CAMNT_0043519375 /DNA_START=64 /DNA_END=324 /DNA_ORIENTATION=+
MKKQTGRHWGPQCSKGANAASAGAHKEPSTQVAAAATRTRPPQRYLSLLPHQGWPLWPLLAHQGSTTAAVTGSVVFRPFEADCFGL